MFDGVEGLGLSHGLVTKFGEETDDAGANVDTSDIYFMTLTEQVHCQCNEWCIVSADDCGVVFDRLNIPAGNNTASFSTSYVGNMPVYIIRDGVRTTKGC
jgi:hypothetical protein